MGRRDSFGQGRDILLAPPIQHANGHRVLAHGFQDLAIGRALRFLIRQILAIHEQEFGAEQPNALRAGLRDQRQFLRNFQIGLQFHGFAIGGHGRQATKPPKPRTFPRISGQLFLRSRQRRRFRVNGDSPRCTVQHYHIIAPHRFRQPRHAKHRRNAKRAQHDGGMAIRAALIGCHASNARRVQ